MGERWPILCKRPIFSLEIGVDEIDEVFGELGGDLFFGAVHEVKADVGFEDFAHEGVDAAADGGEEHELPAAFFVGCEGALDGVELSADLAEALEEFEFFAVGLGHGALLGLTIPTRGMV